MREAFIFHDFGSMHCDGAFCYRTLNIARKLFFLNHFSSILHTARTGLNVER